MSSRSTSFGQSRLITFSPRNVALMLGVLLVLPALIYAAFFEQFYGWYLTTFAGPRLEHELGFTTAWVDYQSASGETVPAFVIVSVVPDGAFDSAGFKPGDVPLGHGHGVEVGFFGELQYSKKHGPVDIWVSALPAGGNERRERRTIRFDARNARPNCSGSGRSSAPDD